MAETVKKDTIREERDNLLQEREDLLQEMENLKKAIAIERENNRILQEIVIRLSGKFTGVI